MPCVLSKYLNTPITDDAIEGLRNLRFGAHALHKKDIRRLRANVERSACDLRRVKSGAVDVNGVRLESQSFIETHGRVRRFAEETNKLY